MTPPLSEKNFSVTLIGAGNVASWLVFALTKAGIPIRQIYGRNLQKCQKLAEKCHAEAIDNLSNLKNNSDLYIFSLKDDAYKLVIPSIPFRLPMAAITAGSVSQEVLSPIADRYGVVYPPQSFTQGADFSDIEVPLCIEGSDENTAKELFAFAQKISSNVQYVNELQRKRLHMAAVFSSNFTNAMYGIGFDLLEKEGLDPKMLLPLLQNTLDKLQTLSPWQSQTGPASRSDKKVMNEHLELLEDSDLQDIYKLISYYILKKTGPDTMEKYKEKLQKITTFIFDFDGVLSDGKILILPDGDQLRSTNAKDGYAMQYALKKGYNVAIISGGYSETMRLRYKNFPNMDIFLKVPDKVAKLKEYMAEKGLTNEQMLIMGDDIPDIAMMKMAALKCCPADAVREVKEISDYISYQNGGNGAVRDVIEQTIKVQGRWLEEDACFW